MHSWLSVRKNCLMLGIETTKLRATPLNGPFEKPIWWMGSFFDLASPDVPVACRQTKGHIHA